MSFYEPDICLYHANCDDGFTAAWAIWQRWPDCEFRPAQYGNQPPPDIAGKHILIVDFSWPRADLEVLAETAASILVLDHHKTAQAELSHMHQIVRPTYENVGRCFSRMSGSPNARVLVEFDMDRSGARMAWNFAHPGDESPLLVDLVEDRDLWRFQHVMTKPVRMLLQSVPRTFSDWSDISGYLDADPDGAALTGSAIQGYYDARVAEMAEAATVQHFAGFDGVPIAHVPYAFVSDVCHQLLAQHPDAPFAAACVVAHGGTTYSLRSSDEREDVSKIAKARGGGGHRNAAGFREAPNG